MLQREVVDREPSSEVLSKVRSCLRNTMPEGLDCFSVLWSTGALSVNIFPCHWHKAGVFTSSPANLVSVLLLCSKLATIARINFMYFRSNSLNNLDMSLGWENFFQILSNKSQETSFFFCWNLLWEYSFSWVPVHRFSKPTEKTSQRNQQGDEGFV